MYASLHPVPQRMTNSNADSIIAVWINWWTQSNAQGGDSRLGYWLGVFAMISTLCGAALIGSIGQAPSPSKQSL
jgi:uncharacterized membrane protein YfcA